MSKNGDLVSIDKEKAEVLKNFIASVFTGNLPSHCSWVNGSQDGGG